MINGDIKNIALMPTGYKDLDPTETVVPYHTDLRNGRVTDAGNWEKRNGYSEKWDIGISEPITLLIPRAIGYAITKNGKIFQLKNTPVETEDIRLSGKNRPVYDEHNDLIIVCDGGHPIKIEKGAARALSEAPATAKFVGRITTYTIMAGHDDTEFRWCASGNPDNWSTGDSGYANVKKDGQKIRFMKTFREKIYFFKDEDIEVWYNRGGDTPFVRLSEMWIPKGLGADYSVVEANNTLYWFGNDGDFFVLNNITPEVISKSYRSYFDDRIKNPLEIYGFDCRKENCIRWFSPTDGLCIKYDYLKNQMSEENTWRLGQFERLPWNSYMEFNNEQYFGDYYPTGKIYHWSKDYLDDNGEPIRVYRKYRIKLTENGNQASVNKLRFVFKRGVANTTVLNPQLTFKIRFDNKTEWETAKTINLGAIGDVDPYVDFYRLGIGREMELEIYESDAVMFLLRDIFLTAQEKGR